MRFLRILFVRSRQKVMTSLALIYSPHFNEIPPQKRGVTGAPYTTIRDNLYETEKKRRKKISLCVSIKKHLDVSERRKMFSTIKMIVK